MRIRRLLASAAVAIAAATAGVVSLAGPADAAPGPWVAYTIIASSRGTVGSVTAVAEIRRSTFVNNYYLKLTCTDTNLYATSVHATWVHSENLFRPGFGVESTAPGPWDSTTSVVYSPTFSLLNDHTRVAGKCSYSYNSLGVVNTPFSAWVWVGQY